MFSLSFTHLRLVCEAQSPLRLDGWRAGSNLRGALGSVMRRAYCAGDRNAPAHASACPVCWLLAANEHPGEERRGYALVPPPASAEVYAPGARFSFGLTLFGSARRFLPYFILAVPEVGREGVGPGRGRFALRQVWAVEPLSGATECVLAEGETLVHFPTLAVVPERVAAAAEALNAVLAEHGRLQLNFLTPLRLITGGELLKTPDFGVLFARLLERLDDLRRQLGDGQRRPLAEVQALQALADRVRLVEAQTQWVEVKSGSSRRGEATWISGLVGRAHYAAPPEIWSPLLPWLVWGQGAQVGKDVVKGNGRYEIEAAGIKRYGEWVNRS